MPIPPMPNPPAIEAPASPAADAPAQHKVIGQASMQADRTIVMDLRMEDAATGSVGDSRVQYPPGSPHYQGILDHLGGLQPGEFKPVMNDWD